MKWWLLLLIPALFALIFGLVFFYMFLPDVSKSPKKVAVQSPVVESESISTFVSHSLTPIKSNQWYSTLYQKFPTQPLYALPLVYVLSPDGLGFSLPDVQPFANTIHASYDKDFTIGVDSPFQKPQIESIGDWNINLLMQTKNKDTMSFALTHGVPFTNIHLSSKQAVITIPNGFKIFSDNASEEVQNDMITAASFLLQTRNHNYLIAFPDKKTIAIEKKSLIITNPVKVFVAVLDERKKYQEFKQISNTEILGTHAEFAIEGKGLVTTYQFTTNQKKPLVAILPHQYDELTSKPPILGTYTTIRGPMRLIKTDSFKTEISLTTPSDSFEKLSHTPQELITQIRDDIDSIIKKEKPASRDYVLGTWFGTVTNLITLTNSLGMQTEKQKLLDFVEPIFIESLNSFSYDDTQTSLVADKPEFGNEKLNDHHFHYGYYIRTAAVLAQQDPTILQSIKPKIDAMVSDIATIKREESKYPFLRNFDIYEGHSWADGYANFTDGNNQESSSEAINAWYGVYLWSKVVKNPELGKYALYLYNTEIQSTYFYWFDKNNIYKDPYKSKIASIVWGGKVEFSTWFSNETNMKYGIELLPFTPASMYLGKVQNFDKYDIDYHENGGNETKSWGDLFVMWKSFYQPEEAMKLKDKVTKFEEANTRSLFLYFLYKNSEK